MGQQPARRPTAAAEQAGRVKRRDFLGAALLAPCVAGTPWAWAQTPKLPDSFALYGKPPEAPAPQRLLAAGRPAAVLLYMLAPQALLGWPTRFTEEALAGIAPAWRELPYLGQLAGRGSTLSLETVVALKPGLIIDTGTLNDTYRSGAERTAQQTGLPYLLIDGDILLAPQTLRTLGRVLGVAQRGEQLAARAREILDEAASLRRRFQTQGKAPSFYMARSADGLETAPFGSIHAQALELCGLRNVAEPVGGAGLARISLEQLLLWDPDYLFTHDPALAATAAQSPQWSRVRAVREGRFIVAPQAPFGWLDIPPGMNRLLGVHWITQALAPSATAAATRESVQDVFELFYHHRLSPSLLDAAARLSV